MKAIIYTDGAARGNPDGPGGYGAIVQILDKDGNRLEKELSGGYPRTTNNRMELMGVISALEELASFKEPCEGFIYSDSRYVVDAFEKHWITNWKKNGWKTSTGNPVKNQDLWNRLLNALEPHSFRFRWVKGHADHPENERCDRLATSAADKVGWGIEDKAEVLTFSTEWETVGGSGTRSQSLPAAPASSQKSGVEGRTSSNGSWPEGRTSSNGSGQAFKAYSGGSVPEEPPQTIRVRYLSDQIEKLQPPTNSANWVDLRSAEDVVLKKGEFRLISLGVAMKLPEGYEAHIVPRSSTYKNFGIIQANHHGVVDNAYSGDNDLWRMPVIALRDTEIHVNDRICQFRIERRQPDIIFEEVDHLGEADRGGFGSTGIQ